METKHRCSQCGTGWNADVGECPECVWQVHVIGMDDVHPARSMRDAQEQAHAINVAALVGTSDGSPHYPLVWAVPRLVAARTAPASEVAATNTEALADLARGWRKKHGEGSPVDRAYLRCADELTSTLHRIEAGA